MGETLLNQGDAGGNTGGNGNSGDSTSSNSGNVSWLDSLPADIKDDPSLKPIKDISGLAKSYVNAQKMIGADKIVLPGKNATEAEWANLYRKMGLPESVDKYELNLPKDQKLDESLVKGFKEAAHKAGVLPNQAEKILNQYIQDTQAVLSKMEADKKVEATQKIEALKTEWGKDFEKNVRTAQVALKEFGDESFTQYLDQTGLGNDPQVIKFMAKLGNLLSEDQIKGANTGQKFGGMTMDEVNQKIAAIQSNPKYSDPSSLFSDREPLINEMQRLMEYKTGERRY
jgi:hypothetical protein